MSQMSQNAARAGLFSAVSLAAVILTTMAMSRHDAPVPESALPVEASASLHSGFGHLRLAPAATYANLTVYPVYAEGAAPARPASPEFLTLAEGMDKGSVQARESDCSCSPIEAIPTNLPAGVIVPGPEVTNAEQGNEHRGANLFMVTNIAPKPTYVPDGQIIPGGGQDRGTAADTIIPARSAQVNVAAFCVEHDRSTGPSNSFRKNVAIAIPSVRYAMQVVGEQQPVWNAVGVATKRFHAATPTGTYATLIQNQSADAAVLPYTDALTVPIQAATPGRVIGVVAAINGHVVCADLYRNPELFNQLWPSLLRSYALQAAMTKSANRQSVNQASAGKWLASLDNAPGTSSRAATLTQVDRVSTQNGAGIRTAAITTTGCQHHLALLHEAFWTPAAVLTN